MKQVMGMILGLFLLSCGGPQTAPPAGEAVSVGVMKVTAQPVEARHTFSGTVEPLERVRLSTRLSGWVEGIYAEEGEAVSAGALLVKLRSNDLQARLARAEAGLAAAEAQFQNAEKNLARMEALFKNKSATRKELDDMRTAFIAAQSGKTAAYQTREEVKEMLRYTRLTAPFAGVVTRKMIEVGDLANPGQPVMVVENIDRVKVMAKVPESAVHKLQKGMKVQISIGANLSAPGENTFSGTIAQIFPAADPQSRQFEVNVLLDNPGHRIKSGMFARISMAEAGAPALFVPLRALIQRGQLQGLFLVDEQQRARLRWIRTGRMQNGWVEVLSGLNMGDRVITEKPLNLQDGQPLEVQTGDASSRNPATREVRG